MVLLTVLMLVACSSPSVLPLLRVTQQAITTEISLLDAEKSRDQSILAERQRSLAAAFDADLRQQQALDADWVREATTGYVAAREALLQHEAAVERERSQRAANLRAAADAQSRAIHLIELEDGLWRALPWPGLELNATPTTSSHREYPNP